MKTLLLLLVIALMTTTVASADDFTLTSDVGGSNCHFTSGPFTQVYVIERFSSGSTGSRFKVTLPPGSSILAFNTPYLSIGAVAADISVGYGACLSGTIVVGGVFSNLTSGTMSVQPATGFANILYTDCRFAELNATSSPGYVDVPGSCNNVLATEPTSWGRVKSLYR